MELVKTISNNKLIKSFLIIILGSVLLTISAKIQIPFYPVPMTMQTLIPSLIPFGRLTLTLLGPFCDVSE